MKYFLLLVLTFSLLCGTMIAQWSQTAGPEGGIVKAFTVNQTNGAFFAGTKAGIYRSSDDGITWSWVTSSLPVTLDITVLYSSGANIYFFGVANGTTGAVYHSSDNGTTWNAKAGTGLPMLAIPYSFLALNSKLYTACYGYPNGGVYVSTDNGSTWTSSGNGIPTDYTPATLSAVGTTMYVGAALATTSKGVYRSTDGGSNWTAVNTTYAGVTAITNIGSTVFLATLNGGVFKSTNNGNNWTGINPSTPLVVLGATALAPTASNLFIGSGTIFKADANGASWDTVTNGLPPRDAGTSINALITHGSTMLAGVANIGLWRSTDAGASWARCNTGFRNANIGGLYVNGSTLYASGVTTGFFKSDDNGDTWTELNNGIDLRQNGYFSFIKSGSTLLGGGGLHGIFLSSDGGTSWTAGNLDKPAYGIVKDETGIYASITGNVAKSTDDGASWTMLNPGLPFYIAALSIWKTDSVILVGCSAGFKRSTDNGATWTAPATGLPGFGGYGYSAFTQIDTTIFVAHSGAVYRSTDKGASWTSSNSGIPFGISPTTLHSHGEFLFAGTSKGVYRSTNYGTSWTAINNGLGIEASISVLTSNDYYLFAGTNPNSVWRIPINQVTAVREIAEPLPASFTLEQNYPNPFNPSTTFRFAITVAGYTSLKIYSILGEEVATVLAEELPAGTYSATWSASNMPSGIYYYRLTSGDYSESKPMVFVK